MLIEMAFIGRLDMPVMQRGLLVIWAVLSGPFILTVIPVKAFDPLRRLFYRLCRRGKLLQTSDSQGRGLLKYTVPQSFFSHFYAVGLLLNTILFFTAIGFASKCSEGVKNQFSSVVAQLGGAGAHHTLFAGDPVPVFGKCSRQAWRLVFLLVLFEIHAIRRLYESLFVAKHHPAARMTFVGYILALGFYVVVPITLFCQAFSNESFGNAFKVFLTQKLKQRGGEWMASVSDIADAEDLISYLGNIGWTSYIGAALVFYGAYHQNTCHEILAALRADDKTGSSRKYYIPEGDWFELVSCPHYLAEIIIYLGFLVASGGTSPLMYFMLGLVIVNLQMIAQPTHEWYLAKFEDYPKSRRAMIPYVG